MERLTTLLTLAVLSALCSLADGQTVRFTVAGDVAKPRTLALPGVDADRGVFLNDLLQDAGIQGDGSAVIVRGEVPQVVGSEWVSAQSAARGSELEHGDIVVFHQISRRSHQLFSRQIVVVAGPTRGVAQLAETGTRLRNLLASLGIVSADGIRVPVIRTDQGGAVRLEAEPDDSLIHGDVVLLSSNGRLSAVAQARIAALFANTADSHSQSTTPSGSQIQTVSDERPTETPLGDSASDWLTLPPVPSSGDKPVAGPAPVPVIRAAVEKAVGPEESRTGPAPVDATPDDLLRGGDQLEGSSADAGGSPLWNGVFVAGLLGSIVLILTGWLKTRRETSAADTSAASTTIDRQLPADTLTPPAVSASFVKSGDGIEVDLKTSESEHRPDSRPADLTHDDPQHAPADSAEAVPTSARVIDCSAVSDQLVEEQEWFGGAWRREAATTATASGGEIDPVQPMEQVDQSVSDTDSPRVSSADSVVSDASPADAAATSASADDFEDLLQNRLPVELQRADLPYRVTLFGRPAGPRRLRIDAAHTQLAAPNFLSGKRSHRGTDQKIMSDSDDQHCEDAASLDRALNSLHEQGH